MHQRAAGRGVPGPGHGLDLPDDDGVVAGVVHGGGPALQHGQRAVEHRRAGDRAGMVGHAVQLAVQRPSPGGQPARGLLVVLGQDRHRPGTLGQDRVVEPGDLLRAEQHQRRVQRDRGERADRHGVAAPGGDHHDAARELARGPPERGVIHAHRGRFPAPRAPARSDRTTNDRATAGQRDHRPAVQVPLARGRVGDDHAAAGDRHGQDERRDDPADGGPQRAADRAHGPGSEQAGGQQHDAEPDRPERARSGCTGSCRSGPPPRRPGTARCTRLR